MTSVDLAKHYRDLYRATDKPGEVMVPERPYLMVDGEGDPNNSQQFSDAIATLYPLAYGVRKEIKDATGIAYKVMPLEGLWWVASGAVLDFEDRSDWRWTLMISLPDEATRELAEDVIAQVSEAKKLPLGDAARWGSYGDGPAVQVLHRGPYATEWPTIQRLHDYILTNQFQFRGKHHEIYLTDPRRGNPENNRTILRQGIDRG